MKIRLILVFSLILLIALFTSGAKLAFAIPPAPPPPPLPGIPASQPIEVPIPPPDPEEEPVPPPPDEPAQEKAPPPPPPTPTPTPCIPAPCFYQVTTCCFNMGCLFLGNSSNTSCKLGNVEGGFRVQSSSESNKNIKLQVKEKNVFLKMLDFLKIIF